MAEEREASKKNEEQKRNSAAIRRVPESGIELLVSGSCFGSLGFFLNLGFEHGAEEQDDKKSGYE